MKKREKFYRKKRQQGATGRSLLCLMLSLGFLLGFPGPVSVQAAETGENVTAEENMETGLNAGMEQDTENKPDTENNQDLETGQTEETEQDSETEATTEESTEVVTYTHTDESGNVFAYHLDENGQAVIFGITLSGSALALPPELDGCVVASVENDKNCVVTNPEIVIPELTVACASVGANAFKGLTIGTLTLAGGINSFQGHVESSTRHTWKQFGDCTIETLIVGVPDFEVVIPQEASLHPDVQGVFAGSQIGKIVFNENVERIPSFLFCGAVLQMEELSLSVPIIGAMAFYGENIHIGNLVLEESVTTFEESPYSTAAHHHYEQFGETEIDCVTLLATTTQLGYKIPTSAVTNFSGPFHGAGLGELIIGENVSVVAELLFQNASLSMDRLELHVQELGAYAFSGTNISFGTLIIGSELQTFAESYYSTAANRYYEQFSAVKVENLVYEAQAAGLSHTKDKGTVTTIHGMFRQADIGTVTIGENVESLPEYLFDSAKMTLEELHVNVKEIGACAFSGEDISIGTLTIGENVEVFGESYYSTAASHKYRQFAAATIGRVCYEAKSAGLSHVAETSFVGTVYGMFRQAEIGALIIGENVENLPEYLFASSEMSLEELYVNVKEIGACAFSGEDISIGTLTIGEDVEVFGESYYSTAASHKYRQFAAATIGRVCYEAKSAGLSHVAGTSSVGTVYGMFRQAKIGALIIGKNVENLPEYLFASSEMSLEELHVNVKEIGACAFSGEDISIGTLTIGEDVEVFAESYYSTTTSHEYKQFASTTIDTVCYNAKSAGLSHVAGKATAFTVYGMFRRADIGNAIIGGAVEVIPEYLFDEAEMELENLALDVKEIGACAFSGEDIFIGTLTIGEDVEVFAESYYSTTTSHEYKQFASTTIDTVCYNAKSAGLSHVAGKATAFTVYGMFRRADIGNAIIGGAVEVIPEYLFDEAEMELENLALDVREIGACAFSGPNISIETLTIGENAQVFSESYFSLASSHEYMQFAYSRIGTLRFLPSALVLTNDVAAMSSTSDVESPFMGSEIKILEISENVTSIPNYIFQEAEMTLDRLTITAGSVGASAFHSSDISIGELIIAENVSAFVTDVSGKSLAFAYNTIGKVFYNAAAAGMDVPKTGTFEPFRSADIAAFSVGENVTFLDNCLLRSNTFTDCYVYAVTTDDTYKAQTLKVSYLPDSANLRIHYNSEFKPYFINGAENVEWLCTEYLIQDGYGDVLYDEETGTYNIEVFQHCSVCGYEVVELEKADLTYELYLSIPVELALTLDAENMTYAGSESIYAYGRLGNAYTGIRISVDENAQEYGTAQKGTEIFDISSYLSMDISGSTEYVCSSTQLQENADFIGNNRVEECDTGELRVSIGAVELLQNGIGTYEIPVPLLIEIMTSESEETIGE